MVRRSNHTCEERARLDVLSDVRPSGQGDWGEGGGGTDLGAGALQPEQFGQVVSGRVVDRVLEHLHLLHQRQVVVVRGHLEREEASSMTTEGLRKDLRGGVKMVWRWWKVRA